MERKDMIAKAKDMGLEFKGNLSNDDLDELIENAELAAKEAQFEKPNEESKKVIKETASKAEKVKQLNEMVIATIIPLDERMRDLPSEMYCVGTKNGFKKQVIKFNKDVLVFRAIVDMLKEKRALIQSKTTVNGKEVVKKVMSSAFAISTREPTEAELAELGKK